MKKKGFLQILRQYSIALFVGLIFGGHSSCSLNSRTQSNTLYSSDKTSSNVVIFPQSNLENKNEINLLLNELDNFAARSSIESLRKKILDKKDFEIRIWVGFSPNITRGLILEHNSIQRVSYLPPTGTDSFEKSSSIQILFPRSGWDEFWSEINTSGILSLPNDSDIEGVEPFPDSDVVLIEVKEGDKYRAFSYGAPCLSKASEAKQLVNSLLTISQNLNIKFYHCD